MVDMRSVSTKRGVMKIKDFRGPAPLAILGTLFPTQLFAQACAQVRPSWDPTSGPINAWGEAAFVFQSPIGIVCLGAFALAVLTMKPTWLFAAGFGAVGLGIVIYLGNTLEDPTGISQQTAAEGCSGPPSVAVAICAIICLICAGIYAAKQRYERLIEG